MAENHFEMMAIKLGEFLTANCLAASFADLDTTQTMNSRDTVDKLIDYLHPWFYRLYSKLRWTLSMHFRYRRIFPSSNPPFELPRSFNDFVLHPNFYGRSRKPWERSGKRKRKKVRSKTRKHHQLPFFIVTACTKSEIRRAFATSSMDFTVDSCKRIDANNTAGETTDRRQMKTVQQIQHGWTPCFQLCVPTKTRLSDAVRKQQSCYAGI